MKEREDLILVVIVLISLLIGVLFGQIPPISGLFFNKTTNITNTTYGIEQVSPGLLVSSINNSMVVRNQEGDSVFIFTSDGKIHTTIRAGDSNPHIRKISGVCSDKSGNIYISDEIGDRIFKFANNGTFVKTWGKTGTDPGYFMAPEGLTILPGNNGKDEFVYVCDTGNNRIQVFDTIGTYIKSFIFDSEKYTGNVEESKKSNDEEVQKVTPEPTKETELRVIPVQSANPATAERNYDVKWDDKEIPITFTVDRKIYLGAQNLSSNSMEIALDNPEKWLPVLKQRLKDPTTWKTLNSTITELRKQAGLNKMNEQQEVNFIIQFVQQIPLSNKSDSRYPVEIILDKTGNTFNKALFLYGLLYEAGYDVVFISYPGLGHAAVGIKTDKNIENSQLKTYKDSDDSVYIVIDPDNPSYMGRLMSKSYSQIDPYVVHILPKNGNGGKFYPSDEYLMYIVESINKLYEKYQFLVAKEKDVKGDDKEKVVSDYKKIKIVLDYVEKNPWNEEGAYMRLKNSKVNDISA
jgi:hypothetical protein